MICQAFGRGDLWQRLASHELPSIQPIWRRVSDWLLQAPEDVPPVVFMTMLWASLDFSPFFGVRWYVSVVCYCMTIWLYNMDTYGHLVKYLGPILSLTMEVWQFKACLPKMLLISVHWLWLMQPYAAFFPTQPYLHVCPTFNALLTARRGGDHSEMRHGQRDFWTEQLGSIDWTSWQNSFKPSQNHSGCMHR